MINADRPTSGHMEEQATEATCAHQAYSIQTESYPDGMFLLLPDHRDARC